MSRPVRVPVEQLQPYLLDVPHPSHIHPEHLPVNPPRLDWAQLFGRQAPLEIEVGFGKGMFLVESAQARPGTNFLGVEIEPKYVMTTAARLAKHRLTQVKVASTEARWFFSLYVLDESVDAVHVYFPDPWWKRRHKKRKVFTPDFVTQITRILKPDGVFHFATDVKDYFDESLDVVDSLGHLSRSQDVMMAPPDVMTNFERKYRLEGRPIYRTHFEKRKAPEA